MFDALMLDVDHVLIEGASTIFVRMINQELFSFSTATGEKDDYSEIKDGAVRAKIYAIATVDGEEGLTMTIDIVESPPGVAKGVFTLFFKTRGLICDELPPEMFEG